MKKLNNGRSGEPTARTSADKRFKGYKREDEKAIRKPDVKKDAVLQQLKDAWRSFDCRSPYDAIEDADNVDNYMGYVEDSYFKAWDLVEKIGYSSPDVKRFSLALEEFQGEDGFGYKAGIFLSALINAGKSERYTIVTRHLTEELNLIGFMNIKDVTIEGNVGTYAGLLMKDGFLIIEGDSGEMTGADLVGGRIVVRQNSKSEVGEDMMDGEIIVLGDVKSIGKIKGGTLVIHGDVENGLHCTEETRSGGEVHIYGECKLDMAMGGGKGKVYHRGNLIYGEKG
jgi:hypothetical protein